MSSRLVIQTMRTARAEEAQSGGALASHVNLLALLLLADSANKGGVCWPSIASLSRLSRLAPRTVRYALDALKADGHISVEKRPGRNDRYTVHPGKICRTTQARGATVKAEADQPRQEMPLPGQDVPDTQASGADESYKEPNNKSGTRLGEPDGPRVPEAPKAVPISTEQLALMRKDPVAYWAAIEAADDTKGSADA